MEMLPPIAKLAANPFTVPLYTFIITSGQDYRIKRIKSELSFSTKLLTDRQFKKA